MGTPCKICRGTGTVRGPSFMLNAERCKCSNGKGLELFDSVHHSLKETRSELRHKLSNIQYIRDAHVFPTYNELNELVDILRDIETITHNFRTEIGNIREQKQEYHKRNP